MLRSKSFETQEVIEIGRKKTGESQCVPILWMGIIEDVFQIEGKECKDQERLKMSWRKSMPERGRCFSNGIGNFVYTSGSGRGEICCSREKFCGGEGGAEKKKKNKTPQGTWQGKAWTGSLWLCYAKPLAGKQKSTISCSRRRRKPTL